MKKFGVILAVFASLVFAGTASANGGGHHYRHHHFPTPAPTPAPPVVPYTQIDREGTCVGGVFEDLTAGQLGFVDGVFTPGATFNGQPVVPAYYVQGLGETCTDPTLLGYTAAGYDVSDLGVVDTAGPQFNVYPYYVP